jgi:hypothetical protein
VFTGRPRVQYSAAETSPGSGVDQLNFFDALEKRDLVSNDDALHAALLVFTGQSPATYSQRAARAKQVGLIPTRFDQPAREAITAGELALILARGLEIPEPASEGAALRALAEAGVAPDFAKENSGVSGAQLLTLLGHVEDAIARRSAGAMAPATGAELARVDLGVWSQPAGSQPGTRKPKQPPIDLEDSAKKPRPGQVVPGGTAPAPAAPAPEAPTPAAVPAAPPPAPAPEVKPDTQPPPTPGSPTPRAGTPLPPPRAEGAMPSRLDGLASDLRYVAVDRVHVEVSEVLGPGEMVQWRTVDDGRGKPGEWQTLQAGQSLDERVEVRTGLGTRATLRVGDGATVVVHRLSRVRLERKVRSDGESQVGITMYRGSLEAAGTQAAGSGRPETAVLIRTPDQLFPVRARSLFEYDAFEGTKAREF